MTEGTLLRNENVIEQSQFFERHEAYSHKERYVLSFKITLVFLWYGEHLTACPTTHLHRKLYSPRTHMSAPT